MQRLRPQLSFSLTTPGDWSQKKGEVIVSVIELLG